jgi:hypothetical protein
MIEQIDVTHGFFIILLQWAVNLTRNVLIQRLVSIETAKIPVCMIDVGSTLSVDRLPIELSASVQKDFWVIHEFSVTVHSA